MQDVTGLRAKTSRGVNFSSACVNRGWSPVSGCRVILQVDGYGNQGKLDGDNAANSVPEVGSTQSIQWIRLPLCSSYILSFDLTPSNFYSELMARTGMSEKAIGTAAGYITATAAANDLDFATRKAG